MTPELILALSIVMISVGLVVIAKRIMRKDREYLEKLRDGNHQV